MGASTQAVQDQCPKSEYACLDVINSSQCIEQLVLEKQAPATKEALIKCVEYEGTVTTLPGATKVRFKRNEDFGTRREYMLIAAQQYCRCPGCHSATINAVIAEMFPPPCA
jgi:hypothetical protein